jgi:hypothetical protein
MGRPLVEKKSARLFDDVKVTELAPDGAPAGSLPGATSAS